MHPILFHLGPFAIPTFGALAALGLMLAEALSQRTAPLAGAPPEAVWNAGLFAVLAAFLISRALLIAANFTAFRAEPLFLLAVPALTPPGLLLTAFALVVHLRRRKLPILRILDAWAPCATLLWATLALGHFAEGSDPGLPTQLPWAMQPFASGPLLEPVALLATLSALVLTGLLLLRLRKPRRPGQTTALALGAAGLSQFFLCFLRQPGPPLLGSLDALQTTALAMIVLAALLLVFLSSPPARAATAL